MDYSILVLSYDKNLDLWDNLFKLLRKNWCDKDAKIYLTTNLLNYDKYDVISIITNEESSPYDRLVRAIRNIEEDYIILFNDDFYIVSEVEKNILDECISFCIENNCHYYNLSKYRKTRDGVYNDERNRYVIGTSEEYAINFGISIWKKDFLEKILSFCYGNPWKIEEYFKFLDNEKIKELGEPLLIQDNRKIINYIPLVMKGKFVRDEYFKCIKNGIKLNTTYREMQSYEEFIKMKIKIIGSKLIPKMQRVIVKNMLRKLGFEFSTNN